MLKTIRAVEVAAHGRGDVKLEHRVAVAVTLELILEKIRLVFGVVHDKPLVGERSDDFARRFIGVAAC